MVVRQRLASSSWVARGLAGSGELGELGGGLLVLALDVLGNGTWEEGPNEYGPILTRKRCLGIAEGAPTVGNIAVGSGGI